MKEILIHGSTLPEAYHEALRRLYLEGDIVSCNDWDQQQKEISATIFIEHPLQEPMISKLYTGGPRELQQYKMEITQGILDFEVRPGKWHYSYHSRITDFQLGGVEDAYYADQLDFVIEELKRQPDSRRAIISIRDNSVDMDSDNPACLQHLQYFIRGGRLHCKAFFRSNDLCKAFFYNAFGLIDLQAMIADKLQVSVGTYTHRANSLHVYSRDWKQLHQYYTAIKTRSHRDLTYHYQFEYKEWMDEAIPEIMQQVEILKERYNESGN